MEECRTLLNPLDHQGLLAQEIPPPLDEIGDDELLAQLGITSAEQAGITELRHVRSTSEKRAAEEIATREKCEDFDRFKPIFEKMQQELSTGLRQTRRFERKSEIAPGRFYILGGQKAYVASMEVPFNNDQGKRDARLRVIFDNGTESNLLLRSLQKALQQDEAGRRIMEPLAGPLFASQNEEGDEASGTIYVVRSKSDHPTVAKYRNSLHKIGETRGTPTRRFANAKLDPTFLMAEIDLVATYEVYNINRIKLENIIHRIFGPARLDIEIKDRFGQPVVPQEWFLVPLFIIDEAVARIKDGTISAYTYDPKTASLVKNTNNENKT